MLRPVALGQDAGGLAGLVPGRARLDVRDLPAMAVAAEADRLLEDRPPPSVVVLVAYAANLAVDDRSRADFGVLVHRPMGRRNMVRNAQRERSIHSVVTRECLGVRI